MHNGNQTGGMTVIVRTVTRLTVGLILLFGIYLVLHGHISPGGGFSGGVVIALAFVHLVLAFGRRGTATGLSESAAGRIESIGALAFLVLGLFGLMAGYFLLNFLHKGEPFTVASAGFIPLCNIAICLKVGAGLFAVFLALVLMRSEPEEDPS